MNTVTIPKKEYEALVFAKNGLKKTAAAKKAFAHAGFGAFKKIPAKMSSVAYINKLRKSWR